MCSSDLPKTVLDINAGAGWNSFLAAREGASVIATDADELAIDNIYKESKNQNLKILSLFMPFSSMSKNIACDLVFCSEVHDIISKYNMQLDDVFKILSNITKQTLVLDFANKKEQDKLNSSAYPIDITINYGLQYFKTVEILDTHTDNNNKLLVFKK